MAKRQMGKRIYREPTAEQAEKYRRIREMIASEIPEIREEARLIRQGRQAKLGEAISLLKQNERFAAFLWPTSATGLA